MRYVPTYHSMCCVAVAAAAARQNEQVLLEKSLSHLLFYNFLPHLSNERTNGHEITENKSSFSKLSEKLPNPTDIDIICTQKRKIRKITSSQNPEERRTDGQADE